MSNNQMTREENLCQTPDARLLVVDDESSNLLLLQAILEEAGYSNIRTTSDPTQVEAIRIEWDPNIVLLDLMMPVMDGFEIMQRLQCSSHDGAFLPILILTADISLETRQRALKEGANDFLAKPFDHTEVLLRIRNLLSLHFVHGQLHDQNLTLEQRVRERTREVEESQL